jgi:hypothetical protein
MDREPCRIDLFQPGDGPGVARLFTEVYGDGYPVKIVYDPEALAAAYAKREYIPFVARTAEGKIVGLTALYRSAPDGELYEIGMTLVLPDYRKTAVTGMLFRHTMKVAPTLPGVAALFCEAVCNHTHVQRAGTLFKLVETGLEVDLMPAEAYEREESAKGRVSTLDMFRTVISNPHIVHLPKVYGDPLRFIYGGFDDSRVFADSEANFPTEGRTTISTQVFSFAKVARLTVSEAGPDFERVLDGEEGRLRDQDILISQAWLKMSWPWVARAVEILRARGYFFGGALPRWFGEDGLLMQKISGRPGWEGIQLHSDRAKEILRFIKEDWGVTKADGGGQG